MRTGFSGLAIIAYCLVLQACSGAKHVYVGEKKLSPQQLQQDFDIAWKTYQKNHPGYDWYTPADSVNARFAAVRASLTDSMTEPEFRIRLSYALAIIRCGHTSVIASKGYRRYAAKYQGPSFPLSVKVWGRDSMVVLHNYLGDSFPVQRGSIITTINDVPASVFIEQMKQYASTDGFSDGFKEIQISSTFPARFKWMYGLPVQYRIGYLDTSSKPATVTLPNYMQFPGKRRHEKDSLPAVQRPDSILVKKKGETYGSFKIDTAHKLAILTLNTFSHPKLPAFIKSGFKKIKKQGIPNLVIDLRSNGGGKIENSTLLTRYIINQPFRVADSAAARNLKLAFPRYTQMGWFYRYFRWTYARKKADGWWHMQQLENQVYQPKKKNHFDGQLYVLTGGATFSASLLFLSKVYRQSNVTVAGEETGGAARGNSAVLIPRITLPNSRVQLRLPLFRMITDTSIAQDGRGIMPDVFARPDSWGIRYNRDAKMEKIYALIAEASGMKP